MPWAESFRDEDFHGLADEVLTPISKQPLDLRVDRSDLAFRVGYNNRVRRGLE
jgi:hypothetical protein